MKLIPWIPPLAVLAIALAVNVSVRRSEWVGFAYAAVLYYSILYGGLGLVTSLGPWVRAGIGVVLPAVVAAALLPQVVGRNPITGGVSAVVLWGGPGLVVANAIGAAAERARHAVDVLVTPDLSRVDLLSALGNDRLLAEAEHVAAQRDGTLLLSWSVFAAKLESHRYRLSILRPDGTLEAAAGSSDAAVAGWPWVVSAAPGGGFLAHHREVSASSPALLLDGAGALVRELRPDPPLRLATPLRLAPDGRLQAIVVEEGRPRLVALALDPGPRLEPLRDLDLPLAPPGAREQRRPIDLLWSGDGALEVLASVEKLGEDGQRDVRADEGRVLLRVAPDGRVEERPLPQLEWRYAGSLEDGTPLFNHSVGDGPFDIWSPRFAPLLVLGRDGPTLLKSGWDGHREGAPWPAALRTVDVGDLEVFGAAPAPGNRIAFLAEKAGGLEIRYVDPEGRAMGVGAIRAAGR